MGGQRQLLVVCTANLCRSPVAEAALGRALAGMVDVDGRTWSVSSAGTERVSAALDPDTVAAAATIGIDLSDHIPRPLEPGLLATADLVLAMGREHVRSVVVADPSAWPRTFTFRELVRRAVALPRPEQGLDAWLVDAGAGRHASDMLRPSPDDDIADPYRRGRSANLATVTELDRLAVELVTWGPWIPRG